MVKNNKEELKFIKGFQKITLTKIAKKLNVPRASIISGATSDENIKKVKKEIEKEIAKLYLDEGEINESETDTL